MIVKGVRGWAAAIAAALSMLAAAGNAAAGEAADKATAAEALAASHDAGALGAADEAVDALWRTVPFQARTALFVDDADNAFAQYTPRASSVFKAGEHANIYLEPVGYGFGTDGAMVRVGFQPALEIRTPDGLIMAKAADFGTLQWSGRAKSREVPATISVALPDLKAGSYLAVVSLTDVTDGKTLTAELPFSIAP